MKKFLILILILLCSVLGFSQDTNTNSERLKKYWYMRWRLVNYFMVKRLFAFLVIISCCQQKLLAQNLEVFGGVNKCSFYNYPKNADGVHFNGEYKGNYGYTMGISLEKLKIDSFSLKLTLNINNYSGKLEVSNGGLGGGSTTKAEVNKYIVGLGIFPVNFNFFKKIELNAGAEFNLLIKEETTGYKSFWTMGNNNVIILGDGAPQINKNFYLGIIGRVAYNVKLNTNWAIVPQYQFYLGLTNEFQNINADVRFLRHFLGGGIKRRIDK